MKKISLMLIVAFSVTAMFAQGMDQKGNKNKWGRENSMKRQRPQMMGREMIEQLDLTTVQQENIEKIRDEHQKKLIDIRAKLEKLRIDKKNAMKTSDFNQAEKITDKISAQRAIIAKDRIKLQEQIFNTLTKDQQAKFKKFRKEHRPMMGERRGYKKGIEGHQMMMGHSDMMGD